MQVLLLPEPASDYLNLFIGCLMPVLTTAGTGDAEDMIKRIEPVRLHWREALRTTASMLQGKTVLVL